MGDEFICASITDTVTESVGGWRFEEVLQEDESIGGNGEPTPERFVVVTLGGEELTLESDGAMRIDGVLTDGRSISVTRGK